MAEFTSLTPDTQVMVPRYTRIHMHAATHAAQSIHTTHTRISQADFDPIKKIVMKQRVDKLEALTQGCFEQQNTYAFFNANGEAMYLVQEDSNCCMRMFCKPSHGAELKFFRTTDGKRFTHDTHLHTYTHKHTQIHTR